MASGPNTTYTYYADGSLRTIAWSPVAGNFTYNYSLNGQYDLITFPNGQTRDYSYDDQGRLTQIANIHPTTGNLATYSYGYDLNNAGGGYTMKGQRTSMTASVPFQNFINSTTDYYYDNNYQLTKSIYPNVAPFNAEISEWTYDDIGNRTQSILNGTPTAYTYFKNGTNSNNGQRLQTDGVNTYAYDLNGNNTSRNGSPGNYTFTWHKLNMMSGISGAATATYAYDFAGRRIQKKIGTTTYNYVYDAQNLIGQRTTGVQDFVFGPSIDEPLATKIGSNIYYYSVDGLGSVALLTDTNGAVQNSYVYDTWGAIRSQSGSLANPFTYTSREANDAGMMFYRARYYNPNLGRFVSEDLIRPLRHNFYPYVLNSPVFRKDPSGLVDIPTHRGWIAADEGAFFYCNDKKTGGCVQLAMTVSCYCTKDCFFNLLWRAHAFFTIEEINIAYRNKADLPALEAMVPRYLTDATTDLQQAKDELEDEVFLTESNCKKGCEFFEILSTNLQAPHLLPPKQKLPPLDQP